MSAYSKFRYGHQSKGLHRERVVGQMLRELEKARLLKSRLKAGELIVGAQLSLEDSAVVEIFGAAGYDYVLIDAEHGSATAPIVKSMLQAGRHTDTVVLARVLRLDPELIRLYLDLGSPGVACPFIETAAQAQHLVDACRYPPLGIRGYGPRRAGNYGFDADDYFAQANDSMVCIAMIESELAIENASEITAVEGLDGVLIGPMDLSINLGVFEDFESDRYLEAVETVRAACRANGTAMGTGCYSIEHAITCRDTGDSLLLALGDEVALRQGAIATLETLRSF